MSEAAFQKAAEEVKQLKSQPTDQEMLDVYSHYKQATVGDVNTGCVRGEERSEKLRSNIMQSNIQLQSNIVEELQQKYLCRRAVPNPRCCL
uniref:Acyl-CoA-binding protein n=1 Tax=Gallus gallus TaxID=9031 RepID=A0A8V0Z8P4_CHICK